MGQAIRRRLRLRRKDLSKILRVDDDSELDELLEDLAVELQRSWAILRDVNLAASDPGSRKTLEWLLTQPDRITEAVWEVDPNTRGLIEDSHPAGLLVLERGDAKDILLACRCALGSLPAAGRGRPPGTADHATRRFALKTAELFRHYTGRDPTRIEDGGSYGAYKDFVVVLLSGVPTRLRRTKTGRMKGADYIAKLGIELLNESNRDRTPLTE